MEIRFLSEWLNGIHMPMVNNIVVFGLVNPIPISLLQMICLQFDVVFFSYVQMSTDAFAFIFSAFNITEFRCFPRNITTKK